MNGYVFVVTRNDRPVAVCPDRDDAAEFIAKAHKNMREWPGGELPPQWRRDVYAMRPFLFDPTA